MDAYTFSAGAECVTLCLAKQAGTLSPFMDLYNTSGTKLASGSSQIQTCFSTSGTFNLFARDSSGLGTGSYKLRLESGTISCSSLDLQDPAVTVITPNGGEIIEAGSTFLIQWASTDSGGITSHEIRFSGNGGASFPTVIATGLAGNVKSFN
jgi:hypothetical protein